MNHQGGPCSCYFFLHFSSLSNSSLANSYPSFKIQINKASPGLSIRPEEKLDNKAIHAYPNPVKSNYNGNISIVGLTDECNVKIVDGSGYVINEGTSNGGIYTWNGRNNRGEKVSSGVYHVLMYDNTGKEGEITKIVITR